MIIDLIYMKDILKTSLILPNIYIFIYLLATIIEYATINKENCGLLGCYNVGEVIKIIISVPAIFFSGKYTAVNFPFVDVVISVTLYFIIGLVIDIIRDSSN